MVPAPSPLPVVAAAIVDSLASPTLLLCTARSYPESLRGRFEFPGGKVEPGEKGEQSLHREIQEELGMSISLGFELMPPAGEAVTEDGLPAWPILEGRTMRVWLAEPRSEAFPGGGDNSHQEALWVPLRNAPELPWLETNRPILNHLLALLLGDAE